MNERIVISEDLAVISAPDGSLLLEVVEAVDKGDVAMIKLIRHEALGLALSMEKVYAKAFHGFLKPYFFGSHGASDAQLRR